MNIEIDEIRGVIINCSICSNQVNKTRQSKSFICDNPNRVMFYIDLFCCIVYWTVLSFYNKLISVIVRGSTTVLNDCP